ncbi:hypothetical protein A6R68_17923, partial [Neotoma lepida]
MGDSGSRRCTLVSRLPIFRKSISRRHDSLPSSPSSGNTAGVHSSSPSSTNSSSGSVGKRRSIFRAPSISFHHKKGSEPKPEPTDQNLSISNGAQPSHSNMQKLSLEEQVKTRGRHSVGFSSSRSKKITRSLTEDFEREKEPSTNKNVFINCLSSGRSEGDDSGFTEEQTRRSLKQSTKKLLPKSFSSHSKFSKSVPQSQSKSLVQQPEFSLAITQYQEREPVLGRPSPSCSVDVTEHAGSSLQSPLLSTDLTTAQTPSEFLALTEDSLSEADAFPKILASSLSPYHEGRYMEQRLRSSSEGTAGSGRMVLKPKEGHAEASSLKKHRAGSSSSKMNSLIYVPEKCGYMNTDLNERAISHLAMVHES